MNSEARSPEELLKLMGQAAYEFEKANRTLRKYEVEKNLREARTSVILYAKRADLLKDKTTREYFQRCLEDDKFKLTIDLVKSFSYMENKEIFEKYYEAEKLAKQAEKEHELWASQIMYYQSVNKLKGVELMTLKSAP